MGTTEQWRRLLVIVLLLAGGVLASTEPRPLHSRPYPQVKLVTSELPLRPPGLTALGQWGLLQGGEPMKGMYFFPGNAGQDGPGTQTFSYWPIDTDYHITKDLKPINWHLHWKDDPAIRSWIIDQMTAVGVNVINYSIWYNSAFEMIKAYPQSSKCVSVQYELQPGQDPPIVAWDCAPEHDNQKWAYDQDLKTIRSRVHDNLCFDVSASNIIVGRECNNSPTQKWDYVDDLLRSRMSTANPKCLTVSYTAVNGEPLRVWDCTGFDNQKFRMSVRSRTWCQSYCDYLWDSVQGKPVKIIPAMDGIGHFPFRFGAEGDSLLFEAIDKAVQRWLKNRDHPKWRESWQQMYDQYGTARYAVELIDVAAHNLHIPEGMNRDEAFVSVLDAIALKIEDKHGVKIGFLIDPGTHNLKDTTYIPIPGRTPFQRATSFLAIMGWRNEAQTPLRTDCLKFPTICDTRYSVEFCNELPACDNNLKLVGNGPDHYRDAIAGAKLRRTKAWIAQGLPVIVDVSPGYNGHLTWRGPNGYVGDNAYGYDDIWRNYMNAFRGIGNVGVTVTSWNGFTEGMAVMPGKRKPGPHISSAVNQPSEYTIRYEWVRRLFAGDPRD